MKESRSFLATFSDSFRVFIGDIGDDDDTVNAVDTGKLSVGRIEIPMEMFRISNREAILSGT